MVKGRAGRQSNHVMLKNRPKSDDKMTTWPATDQAQETKLTKNTILMFQFKKNVPIVCKICSQDVDKILMVLLFVNVKKKKKKKKKLTEQKTLTQNGRIMGRDQNSVSSLFFCN